MSSLENLYAVVNCDLQGSQKHAFIKAMSDDYNMFVMLGSAGSGKTFLTNKIATAKEEKGWNVLRTATTGVAATLVGGATLASTLGLGINNVLPFPMQDSGTGTHDTRRSPSNAFMSSQLAGCKSKKIFLIVDEISMASAEQLVLMIEVLEYAKKTIPGFEYQVMVIGDFRQLEPVFKKGSSPWPEYSTPAHLPATFKQSGGADEHEYVHQSPFEGFPCLLKNSSDKQWSVIKTALLENHRQNEAEGSFIEFLRKLGDGQLGSHPFSDYLYEEKDGSYLPVGLNKFSVTTKEDAKDALHVFSSNAACAAHNQKVKEERFAADPNLSVQTFKAKVKYRDGYPGGRSAFVKAVMGATTEVQELYVGALFMCRANVAGSQLRNGTVGTIEALGSDYVKLRVKNSDGTSYTELLYEQQAICPTKPDGSGYGSVKYLPGHLAHALTPWKCQGLTWSGKVVFHVGQSWPQHGLSYVVSSRVTRGEDLIVVSEGKYAHSKTNPVYKEFISRVEKETQMEMYQINSQHGYEVESVEDAWKSTVSIKQANTEYRLPFIFGNLIAAEACAVEGKASRPMSKVEMTDCLAKVETSEVSTVANFEIAFKISVTPILRWAESSMGGVTSYLKNGGSANVLSSAFDSKPDFVKKAMACYDFCVGGCTTDAVEVLLQTKFDSNIDIPFGEYVESSEVSVDEQVENMVLSTQQYDDYSAKNSLATLFKLSRELKSYVAKSGKPIDGWDVEVLDVRFDDVRTSVANISTNGFYKEAVIEKVVAVDVEPAVVTKVVEPTLTEYDHAIMKLMCYAAEKQAALKGLTEARYPLLTVGGASLLLMALGLKQDLESIPSTAKPTDKLVNYITVDRSNLFSAGEYLPTDKVATMFKTDEDRIISLVKEVVAA